MTGVCSFMGCRLETSKRNSEIAINNFFLIPPEIGKSTRPWSWHQFSISFSSMTFYVLMTSFPTSAPRELFLICRKTVKRELNFKTQRKTACWFCFTSSHSPDTENASEQSVACKQTLMLLNLTSSFCFLLIFVYDFKKTSRHLGFKFDYTRHSVLMAYLRQHYS